MSLPEPSFIDRDPEAITKEMVAWWEYETKKTLYDGQPEAVLIDLLAYRESLCRIGVQEAAKQNLVAYARYPMIDYLGQLVGVTRLDGEADDRLRERILLAPESFTTAGSRGSYIFHAMSADASIIDVAVVSHTPGEVSLYPLLPEGSTEVEAIHAAVLAQCSAETVRPLCDTVLVAAPERTEYEISIIIDLYSSVDSGVVLAQSEAAILALTSARAVELGKDVTLSALIAAAHVDGVYRVQVSGPLSDVIVPSYGVAVAVAQEVSIGEVVDE